MSQSKAQNGSQDSGQANYTRQQQNSPNSGPRKPQAGGSQQDVYDEDIPF